VHIQKLTHWKEDFLTKALIFIASCLTGSKSGRKLRSGPSGREVILTHAVSRIMLHNSVKNIQVSWPKEGLRMAQWLLHCGVNDLGGEKLHKRRWFSLFCKLGC